MRVLVVTNMYPSVDPSWGTFVGDQVASLRRLGVDVDVLEIDGRRHRRAYLTGFLRLWEQLRRSRYDVIHAHNILSGVVARAQRSHPVVLTQHGFIEVALSRLQSALTRAFSRSMSEVIYVSSDLRAAARRPTGWVIPCGIDLDRFAPHPRAEARRLLELSPDEPLVLFVGDPARPEKRHGLARRAVELAQREVPAARLITVRGEPHERVALFMSACDVLLLTSSTEGSPMVIKEALACNLPIVSTRVGDVPQVIDGIAGCELADATPHDLAARLVPALQRVGRTAGRERARQFETGVAAKQVLEVYVSALTPQP